MKLLKPKFWDQNQFSIFSILLYPITLIFKIVIFFKYSFTKKYKSSIPVICVGNIYLGGTGKTPFCIELFSILKSLDKNPAFIRKKYKSFQDEMLLLKRIGPLFEENKRINALNNAILNEHNVAIFDDGFQDVSIKKDMSIICFNEKQWIGNGFVIPSGPLREDLSVLCRASLVIINGEKNLKIEQKILEKNKQIKIFYIKYKLTNISGLKNKNIISFAGIGNPINFFSLLKESNINSLEEISFPDHYNYSDKELEKLIKKAKDKNAILLTTEKDYVRINDRFKENIKYTKLIIEVENRNQLIGEIKKIL